MAGVAKGLVALIHFYCDRGRRADTLHRGFEQAVHDGLGLDAGLEPLVDLTRRRHRAFADAVQRRLLQEVRMATGWPRSVLKTC